MSSTKLKVSLLYFFLFFIVAFNSNAQSWEWLKTMRGATGQQEGKYIGRDTLGNVYVIGEFSGTIDFGSVQLTTSSQRLFLAKYDSLGNLGWARMHSDTGLSLNKASIAKNGQLFILCQPGYSNGNILSYDKDGNLLWEQNANFPEPIVAGFRGDLFMKNLIDLQIDRYNNVYLIYENYDQYGTTSGGLPTVHIFVNNLGSDALKINKDGQIIWRKTLVSNSSSYYGESYLQPHFSISLDTLYCYYSSQNNQGTINFGNTFSFNNDGKVNFLAKYNLDGNILFARDINSTLYSMDWNFNAMIGFLKIDNVRKKIFLVQNISSPFIANGITYIPNNNSDNTVDDVALLSLDLVGNILDVKVLGGIFNDYCFGTDLDRDGNLYLSGFYNRTATFGSQQLSSNGQNGFIVKLDTNGNAIWAKNLGSGNGESANSVVSDPKGTVYTTGLYYNNAAFDQDTLQSLGFGDAFVGKLSCVPYVNPIISGDTLVCLGLKNYTVSGIAGVSYVWSVTGGGSIVGSGNAIAVNWSVPGFYTLQITPQNACGNGMPRNIHVRVKDIPSRPTITGNALVCLGTNAYNVTLKPEETYAWSVSGGGSLISINNTAVVNWVLTGNYNLQVVPSNMCGLGSAGTAAIDVGNLPEKPSSIAGSNTVCLGNYTYFTTSVPGVSYNWSLSSGGSLLAQGALAQANWLIPGTHLLSVTPNNRCGTGPTQSATIQVNDVPVQPSAINGSVSLCPGSTNYTVPQIPGTTYNWSISGGGTVLNSSGNAQVNWIIPGLYTISVTPSNACGSGTSKSLSVRVIDVPAQPGSIVGLNTVCLGTQNYTVPLASNVNYQWALSSGGTLNATGNIVQVSWLTPGTYTLNVTPFNTCGYGVPSELIVTVNNTSAQINNIVGKNNVCLASELYSVPTVPGFTYNWALNDGGALSSSDNQATVVWNKIGLFSLSVSTPDGCVKAIQVNVKDIPGKPTGFSGDTSVCIGSAPYQVDYISDNTYAWSLSSGGNVAPLFNTANVVWSVTGIHVLTVIPTNTCGSGQPLAQRITVTGVPVMPITITGLDKACVDLAATYKVSTISGLSYQWTLASGGILLQNASQSDVTWKSTGSYQLSVKALNQCGTSPVQIKLIEVSSIPGTTVISGDTAVCIGISDYMVSVIAGASYQWLLNGGGILTSSGLSAQVNWTAAGMYALTIIPSNFCGNGPISIIDVHVHTIPSAPGAISGDTSICKGLSSYYIGNTNENYQWSINDGGFLSQLSNSASINWTKSGRFQISVTPLNFCGAGIASTLYVNVLSSPGIPALVNNTDTVVCFGRKTYKVVDKGELYTWQLVQGGVINSQAGDSVMVTWNTAGNYQLIINAINKCAASPAKNQTIKVFDKPGAFSISGDSTACLNSSNKYTVTSINTPRNLAWKIIGNPVVISSGDSTLIIPTSIGTFTLSVTSSNLCGYGPGNSKSFRVKTIPSGAFVLTGDSLVCKQSVDYQATYSTDANYLWNIPAGFNAVTNHNLATLNWTKAGNYVITVTPYNNCGNGATVEKSISVLSSGTTGFAISGPDTVCNIFTLFETDSVPLTNYYWNVTGNAEIKDLASPHKKEIQFTNEGYYTITVLPENLCGIGTSSSKVVKVSTKPSKPTISVSSKAICPGDSAICEVENPEENQQFIWSMSGAGTSKSDGSVYTIFPSTSGMYVISSSGINGCGQGAVASVKLTVNELPVLNANISGDTIACTNQTSTYNLTPVSKIEKVWSIDPKIPISNDVNESVFLQWEQSGNYKLYVLPHNECGNGNPVYLNIKINATPKSPKISRTNDTLYSDFPGKNIWYYNNEKMTENSPILYTGSNYGIYYAIAENNCGLGTKSEDFYYGDLNNYGFQVIPNPAAEQVTIKVPWFLKWDKIEIINGWGQVIVKISNPNKVNEINTSLESFADGLYTIRISTELGEYTKKLVVIH